MTNFSKADVNVSGINASIDGSKFFNNTTSDEFYKNLNHQLFIIIYPFLTLIGVSGNLSSLIVMNRPRMRSTVNSVIISALSVADSLVLILNFFLKFDEWLNNRRILDASLVFCKIYRHVFQICTTYSAWLVVFLSLERFIVVWFPFKSKFLVTKRKSIILVSLLPVTIAAVFAYVYLMWEIGPFGKCIFAREYLYFMTKWEPIVIYSLYSYIPSIILIVSTTCIIIKMVETKKKRSEITNKSHTALYETTVTKKVVATCVTYLVLTIPFSMFFTYLYFNETLVVVGPKLKVTRTVVRILGFSNHSFNFFIYVLSSRNFRQEIQSMLSSQTTRSDTGTSRAQGTTSEMNIM